MRILTLILTTLLSLSACKKDENTIIVGTIAGPETELVIAAQAVAKKDYGLTIKIKEFSDYLMPNIALNDGSIDANIYQHQPYLEQSRKARGLAIEAIGKTFVYPMAIYSKTLTDLKKLPKGASVAIPNDPSNEARALLVLQSAGLLAVNGGAQASIHSISDNPKKLKLIALDAAQLPRSLNDVSLAVINTSFAIPAGLSPKKDGLYLEKKDSPYANLIVVQTKNKNNRQLLNLVKAMQSAAVQQKAKALFKGQAIAAF